MIQNITREELVGKYKDNHGFAFVCAHPISDRSIINLADTLIQQGITQSQPLAVTRYKQSIIFVYDDFDGPKFFATAQHFEMICGVARVIPFLEYIYATDPK